MLLGEDGIPKQTELITGAQEGDKPRSSEFSSQHGNRKHSYSHDSLKVA